MRTKNETVSLNYNSNLLSSAIEKPSLHYPPLQLELPSSSFDTIASTLFSFRLQLELPSSSFDTIAVHPILLSSAIGIPLLHFLYNRRPPYSPLVCNWNCPPPLPIQSPSTLFSFRLQLELTSSTFY